jgi:predicted GIY-YIG superfamily endonuclease
MVAYVYMLRCSDGSLYVGSTRNLSRRLWEHQEALGAAYTRRRRPVALVWSGEYPNVGEAFAWEKRIQTWSRAKRLALIAGDYESLPELAKKKFGRPVARPLRPAEPSAVDHLARLEAMTRPVEVVAVTDHFLACLGSIRPGLIHGLYLHGSLCWGEFFHDSDIDFVAVLSRVPGADDLTSLEAAHAQVRQALPERRFEGFHCQIGGLARPASELGPVPTHFDGTFDVAGLTDVNPVTWHELADRGIVVRGGLPRIHTDLEELLDFTWANLASYWQPLLGRVQRAGDQAVGEDSATIAWVVLGVARLHHLLARREITSKSGAGHYILEALDSRWHALAGEALAIRERKGASSTYAEPRVRGRDVREFLAWAIADGRHLR